MNVLIDVRPLLDKPYTGVAQYTLNYLNQKLAQDQTNRYFLFYNSAKCQNKDLPVFDYSNVKIVDFHWPNKIFNLLLRFLNWPKIDRLVERKTGHKIDEVFLPNFNFVAFSKNLKKTLVVHDLSFEFYPHFFTSRQRLWHRLIRPPKICQQATQIITHSENTKNDLIRFYKIDEKKIEIQKPPINSEFHKISEIQSLQGKPVNTKTQKVKDKYQLPEKFILYLGNLEPRKNLDTLIRAFQKFIIHNSLFIIHLIIAGDGRERKKLENLVRKLKLGERVKFFGYISEEDKLALYNLARVFVYPSFYEGFGYPVAEALACGLPVITSHTSSLTEIESDKIIFVNPHDINDLEKVLKEISGKFI